MVKHITTTFECPLCEKTDLNENQVYGLEYNVNESPEPTPRGFDLTNPNRTNLHICKRCTKWLKKLGLPLEEE